MRKAVFEASGLLRGSSAPALETYLRRQPGIHEAEASYMSETVTVAFDERTISDEDVGRLIEDFGCTCRGEALPEHLCAPILRPSRDARPAARSEQAPSHSTPRRSGPSTTDTPPRLQRRLLLRVRPITRERPRRWRSTPPGTTVPRRLSRLLPHLLARRPRWRARWGTVAG